MNEPVWLDRDLVLAIHDRQISEHGGSSGVRDEGLLESALARPRNVFAYGEPRLAALAAEYAFGIARNHPFVDGNKRTALVAAELFLDFNDVDLLATDAEAVTAFLALAAGELSLEGLTTWLEQNSRSR